MLHEARDRQKFVCDVQCLRDMQHKVDSEYQACLRRQEHRRDANEKKQDQLWGQEMGFERSRFSSGSSSKQSSGEEDPLTEPRSCTKTSGVKCDSRLPAIDQPSVKQKHKSTMTPRKPEPSKPSPVTQAPKILSRKRRPNLGRLTVSPEMHNPRASGDRSRQKLQLPVKALALRGAEPGAQQEVSMWVGETKMKRPTRERRSLASSSQLMVTAENPPERARRGDPSAPSQNEPHSALTQAFQETNGPQMLSESMGPPPIPTAVGGPRRAPFRFRDEDFYSILSVNTGGENDDTEDETHEEEELLMAGMCSPSSPANHKRSRFLATSANRAKNKTSEENAEHSRGNSLRRREPNHSSLRTGNSTEPLPTQSSVGQKTVPAPRLPDGEPAKENDGVGAENEKKTPRSVDAASQPRQDDGLHGESGPSESLPMEDRPDGPYYERDWQNYLSGTRNTLGHLLSARPVAPRSSVTASYTAPGAFVHFALTNDVPIDLATTSTLGHSSGSEGNTRFSVRRPLSPIRNRNSLASAENQHYFPVNSAHEFDAQRAEDITSTRQPRGAPLYTEGLFIDPHVDSSLEHSPGASPSRMNLQGHLLVPGSLQENIPFTFFTVSDFPNQNNNGSSVSVPGFTDGREATEVKTDPEKLKKLQESLLEEDSEEEGDLCRICQIAGGSPANPLLEPCGCVGSLQFVHQECLKKWLKVKITSGADLGSVKTCEMCKQSLLVNLDNFNVTEFYQKHQQSRAQNELMNSGLYLVLLLHLYEQRFAELMRLNYGRASRERLSRNYPQPRPEENENSELGDESAYPGRVV